MTEEKKKPEKTPWIEDEKLVAVIKDGRRVVLPRREAEKFEAEQARLAQERLARVDDGRR